MGELVDLFDKLGVDLGLASSIGVTVYAVVALLRSELKGEKMKGWKSKAVGGVLALLLAWKAIPLEIGAEAGSIYTMVVTGLVGWGTAMFGSKKFKGSVLEIKRNGNT